jgi:hypothetical protein
VSAAMVLGMLALRRDLRPPCCLPAADFRGFTCRGCAFPIHADCSLGHPTSVTMDGSRRRVAPKSPHAQEQYESRPTCATSAQAGAIGADWLVPT